MAHFAELDSNNVVLQVLVVGNDDITDANGMEQETLGVLFLQSLLGASSRWLQTSYNGNIRKNYAGVGFIYDGTRDAFIPPQPYPSWLLNEDTCLWEAPVPMPEDGQLYTWVEDQGQWVVVPEDPKGGEDTITFSGGATTGAFG
jgi:hypothetical protein